MDPYVDVLEMPDDASIQEAGERAYRHFAVQSGTTQIDLAFEYIQSYTHPRHILMRATCEVMNA